MKKPTFRGGHNIAMKVPSHQWEKTVLFYENVIGLKVLEKNLNYAIPSVCFEYGSNKLWVDKVESISQAELWLDLVTDNANDASLYLKSSNIVRCDEIEKLPEDFEGFWITNPASIITNIKTAKDE